MSQIHKIIALLLFSSVTFAQNVTVDINRNVQRSINGISTLDRGKFFNIHDSATDADGINFRNDYNVGRGRGFWGAFSYANSQTGSVGNYPAAQNGDDSVRPVESYVATEHPYSAFTNGIDVAAAADWAVEYYKDVYGNNTNPRPEFFEVMNEPFVHAVDYDDATTTAAQIKTQMANLYREVGLRFSQTPALANMKIIGYSSAWPSMELWDFDHWNQNMKMFIDTAGDYMHGFSVHLYDGINIVGADSKRSGSNSEAILDLIETYSYAKWGLIKPHAITEYGAIEAGYGDDYSDIANAQTMRSLNHILFNLIDREDRISISMPFVTGKSTWHINAGNNYQPYGAVLWKPSNIGQPNPTGWVYTPRILFYELWKDVKGDRAQIKSDNPDIQTQAFIDSNILYVALSNLDDTNQTVDLNLLSGLTGLTNVQTKSLKIYAQAMPVLSDTDSATAPASITLIPDETVVLAYTFSNTITPISTINQVNYYTANHLNPIVANTSQVYNFNGVVANSGFAYLRMSIGRKHDKSKSPTVTVNGTPVTVPSNWAGYDQANRTDFFGTIVIPVPFNVLQSNNTVSITFPDGGGRVSSLILNVENETNTLSTGDLALDEANIFAYPNPAKNSLHVNLGKLKGNTIEAAVYSNIGALVRKKTLTNNSQTITLDTKNLASGLYYLVLRSEDAKEALKFLKE